MKKFTKIFASLMLGSLFLTSSVVAYGATVQAGESVRVTAPVNDDAYYAGGTAIIDTETIGDLFIAGGQIEINGNVTQDLMVTGGRVIVNGIIKDDIRIAGGEVTINNEVGDDVIVFGGKVNVGKNAIIGGSFLGASGYLTIDGIVMEDVKGFFGMLTLNGSVRRNVDVTIEEKLEIAQGASIDGDLKYSAIVPANVPQGAVKGKTEFNKVIGHSKDDSAKAANYGYLIFKVISLLSVLLITLIMVLASPKYLTKAAERTKKDILSAFGVGLLGLIVGFLFSIVLMITIIGAPIGLILFVCLFIALYMSKVFIAAWAANYVFKFTKRKKHLKLYMFSGMTAALVLYYLIGMIPFVGWIVSGILVCIGVGTIILTKKDYWEYLKEQGMI